jgi:hypothetical protein
MARGWESKSIESQMESARESHTDGPQELSINDKKLARERQNLLLSRAYIGQQMRSSSNSRYTESLRRALEEIDGKLAKLQHGE